MVRKRFWAVVDRCLAKVGLLRRSQEMIREFYYSSETGVFKVVFRSGFRLTGFDTRTSLKSIRYPENPLPPQAAAEPLRAAEPS